MRHPFVSGGILAYTIPFTRQFDYAVRRVTRIWRGRWFATTTHEDGMMQRKIVLARLLAGLVACGGFFMSAHRHPGAEAETARKKETWKPEEFIFRRTK